MKGIYFINERISFEGFSKEESIQMQEQAIKNFLSVQNIQVVTLNPHQLNEYYSIPHALLYDLKKENSQFDCLVYYSLPAIADFIYTYPAKWLILKSFFKEIINVDKSSDFTIQQVI
ncbi:hypothetical protein [Neobacillus jeddahensis]|uniref:hypothetical protein n=1 Tax=Neobacillus jeddahensis TaxID=1461580 RepID=UPI0005901102|nr:hypothetical protein [Neobacillus jeddahensis]